VGIEKKTGGGGDVVLNGTLWFLGFRGNGEILIRKNGQSIKGK